VASWGVLGAAQILRKVAESAEFGNATPKETACKGDRLLRKRIPTGGAPAPGRQKVVAARLLRILAENFRPRAGLGLSPLTTYGASFPRRSKVPNARHASADPPRLRP